MAYSLHIERAEEPIALEEWMGVAFAIQGARLLGAERRTVNPHTGETIQINGGEGDIEISLPPCSECFSYRRGRETFRARGEYEDRTNLFGRRLQRLQTLLGQESLATRARLIRMVRTYNVLFNPAALGAGQRRRWASAKRRVEGAKSAFAQEVPHERST